MDQIEKRIQSWLDGPFDEATKKEILALKKSDPAKLKDAFSDDLTFGTGGMRGLMGVGSNRMNLYTVSKATLGIARYFKKLLKEKPLKAVIAYDTRNHSFEFAKQAAMVLASEGVDVVLTIAIRPTPFASFLVRHRHADFGAMITASHNPKEYNGYKVYGSDGAQLVAPHDHSIEALIKTLKFEELPKDLDPISKKITFSGAEDDSAYLNALFEVAIHPKQSHDFGNTLSILYTNLHGTGITLLPEALAQLGFTKLHFVKEQTTLDGNFPYAPYPNPEIPETLKLGKDQLLKENLDLFLATDPDADRLAAGVIHKGKPYVLSGNEMAFLSLHHLLSSLEQKGPLSQDLTVVSTIVTTRLLKKVAEDFDITYIDVLTGFKYIGEVIRKQEQHQLKGKFIFGAEESYGFLFGTYARDKDGIAASCLIAEMTLHHKLKGKSLIDELYELYRIYGIIREGAATLNLSEGIKGIQEKDKVMESLRKAALTQFDGIEVTFIEDYLSLEKVELSTGKKTPLDLPKSDVLVFYLDDDSSFIVRPSGTEPKIKIYGNYSIRSFLEVETAIVECEGHLKSRLANVKKLLESYLR